jgi:hypothetical protein
VGSAGLCLSDVLLLGSAERQAVGGGLNPPAGATPALPTHELADQSSVLVEQLEERGVQRQALGRIGERVLHTR